MSNVDSPGDPTVDPSLWSLIDSAELVGAVCDRRSARIQSPMAGRADLLRAAPTQVDRKTYAGVLRAKGLRPATGLGSNCITTRIGGVE
mmetsp:Transcript_52515/g.152949  ORF Transcript_52515/g.152949 Transcript_52515/m.152949 type:complete len:89 (-) Transcript_52515:600-866(-)